jgi:hypothetical protein
MASGLGTVQKSILDVLEARSARDPESAVTMVDIARQIFGTPSPVQEQGVRNALRTLERRGLLRSQFLYRNEYGIAGGRLSAYLTDGRTDQS